MKILLTLSLVYWTLSLHAQLDTSLIHAIPTTMEEYNYMTKGYKIQIESGLDMKKGYFFKDIGEHQIGNYHFTLKNLVRENLRQLAGTLIISRSDVTNKVYYSAIPVNNPELMKLYASEIAKWDDGLTAAYCQIISAYLSTYILSAHQQGINE